MKTTIATALIVAASAVSAETPTSYAYEAVMQELGGGTYNVLAHEFANCPAKGGTTEELFTLIQAPLGAERDAAINTIFETSPEAVECFFEVIERYDLLEDGAELPVQ